MREQCSDLGAKDEPQRKVAKVAATSEASTSCENDHPPADECPEEQNQLEISTSDPTEFGTVNDVNAVEECGTCIVLKATNRQLLNRVKTLTGALGKRREERKSEQRKHRREGIT